MSGDHTRLAIVAADGRLSLVVGLHAQIAQSLGEAFGAALLLGVLLLGAIVRIVGKPTPACVGTSQECEV